MLTGPKESVLRLLMHMWDNDKFIPGYWKGAPDNFARDAMVSLLRSVHSIGSGI